MMTNDSFEKELLSNGVSLNQIKEIKKDKIEIDALESELERELNGR